MKFELSEGGGYLDLYDSNGEYLNAFVALPSGRRYTKFVAVVPGHEATKFDTVEEAQEWIIQTMIEDKLS